MFYQMTKNNAYAVTSHNVRYKSAKEAAKQLGLDFEEEEM